MASSNLYPPIIDTYMPAFVGDEVEIYFSLSKFNSLNDITGVWVTLTDPNTNKSLLKSNTDVLLFNNISVSNDEKRGDNKYYITLKNSDLNKGQWENNKIYKVQIRFSSTINSDLTEENKMDWIVNNSNLFSEWSTICLITPIAKPILSLKGFSSNKTTLSFVNTYLTGYLTTEAPEELESYNIKIYKSNDLQTCLYDSGNIYTNEFAPNEINHEMLFYFEEGTDYTLSFSYITSSLYQASEQFEFIIINTFSDSLKAKLAAEGNNAAGCIDLTIQPTETLFGTYTVRRTSHKSNFTLWEEIDNIIITDNIKPGETFTWKDYTAESGVWYKYCIQRKYKNGNRGLATVTEEPALLFLEDMFLLGQDQQLKIKFDPQINSYSHTVQDTLTQAIGSKYPFIKRNGAIKYRQFGISGLISHFCDEEHLFITEDDLYYGNKNLYTEFNNVHSITPYNDITLEKEFREKVLDFLYDGKPKLYKSGTEKNMIVRLMNISLTPESVLGRMLYRFSATAYEIDDLTIENLHKHNIHTINDYIEEVSEVEDWTFEFIVIEKDILTTIKSLVKNNTPASVSTEIKGIKSLSFYYDNLPYPINIKTNGETGDEKGNVLGHLLTINGNPIIVNKNGEYHLTDIFDFSIGSIAADERDLEHLKVQVILTVQQKEIVEEQPISISYYQSIGQVEDLFLPTEDVIEEYIKPKYDYNKNGVIRKLYSLDNMSIQADKGVVLYISEGSSNDFSKIVFEENTTLSLESKNIAPGKIYFAGSLHEPPYEIYTSYDSVQEITPIVGALYTVNNLEGLDIKDLEINFNNLYADIINKAKEEKKVIFIFDNWHLYSQDEKIIIHPVSAQINYTYEYEEGVYKNNEEEI